MQRAMMSKLVSWKNDPARKPLLLEGARQTGKTWLVQHFAQEHFPSHIYVSLENNEAARSVFDGDLDPHKILARLSTLTNQPYIPGQTLLVLDEIQEQPRALTSLKYFCEDAPEVPVLATGSALGVTLHGGTQFPVGKVTIEHLRPMTFSEFLRALGQPLLADAVEAGDPDAFGLYHSTLSGLFDQYLAVGGMPAVVSAFVALTGAEAFAAADGELDRILADYRHDFSKHTPSDQPSLPLRLGQIWDSMPSQIASETGRFAYARIKKGARGREYDLAIQWLEDSSLVLKVPLVSQPVLPLAAYRKPDSFKLYLSDVGLFRRLSQIPAAMVASGQEVLGQAKGPLAEQYVCQQLFASGFAPASWIETKNPKELDFLVQSDRAVLPVEVKAGTNLKAASLKAMIKRFGFPDALRLSKLPYRRDGVITDAPLWATESLCPESPLPEWFRQP